MKAVNPFFHVIAGTVAALTRRCPNCGHRQIVATSHRNESVACRRCGAAIPPRRDHEGRPL